MAVEYEVSLEVDADIAEAFATWLDRHVDAMLALPGFTGAEWLAVREPLADGCVGWCVRYRLVDATALATYLDTHAATMRADGRARFGERFRASRRVLQPSGLKSRA